MVHVIRPNVEKHAVKMMEELHQMKRENDHCDFIVQVGDDVYYTHKNVLSAGSDYFKAMLKHDTKEHREGRVVFKEVDSECVKNCIDFIYSGNFEISDEKITDLLHVACLMQLEDVKHEVSDILAETVTAASYFSTRHIADMYGLVAVSAKCKVFFHENIMEISNQPEFGNVGKKHIFAILKSRNSKICEKDKLILFLKWIEYNQNKELNFHECLEVIKFDEISSAFLQQLLETHTIISNDLALYKFINQHLLKAPRRPEKTGEEIDKHELIFLFDDDTDCIRSFNTITEELEKFHDEKFKHWKRFGTIANDSYIYVLCQDKSVHRLNFQIRNSKWETMNDMNRDHGEYPRSVSLSGSIFVIGGSFPKISRAVETFHSSANKWVQLKDKPTAIACASLVSLNDSIYCIGGLGEKGFHVSSFCRFTPSKIAWVDLQPMRFPVCGSGVVAVNQKILVIGGKSKLEKLNSVECYDVLSAQWTSLSSMNASHSLVSAYHVGNWIFTVSDFETSDEFEKYDISNDKWITVKPNAHQCFKIYISAIAKI